MKARPLHPIDEVAAKLAAGRAPDAGPRPPGPPRWLVLAHFAVAAVAFWVFAARFFMGSGRLLGFDFQARWALGLVHTATLGWVAMTLLGATLQMSSSHGGVALKSPRLAAAAWALLAGGLVVFVGLLWAGRERYWYGAALAAGGVTLYLVVLARTMAATRTRDVTFWHLSNGLAYLALLATLGVLLAVDRQRGLYLRDPEGTLIAHIHLALVGWVSTSIAGASYRLVPAISAYRSRVSRWPSRLLLAVLNLGVLGLAFDGLFLGRRHMPVWACCLAAAYALYAWQALRGPQPPLSPSSAMTYVALGGGALWTALGLALAWGALPPDVEPRAAYVFAALLGWITPHILAQIQKILPFLVWLTLSKLVPAESLPSMQAFSSSKLAWAQVVLLAAAVPCGVAGFLLERRSLLAVSGAFLLGTATAYVLQVARALAALRPCRLKALAERQGCPLA